MEQAPAFELAMRLGSLALERGRAKGDPSHDVQHLRRVVSTVRRLASSTHASESETFVSLVGAALHDYADAKLLEPGETKRDAMSRLETEFVAPCLQNGWLDREECDRVVQIVERTGYSVMKREAEEDCERVRFLELDLVRDADLLDSIGAIGIARCLSYGACHGRKLRSTEQKMRDWETRPENRPPDRFPPPNDGTPIGGSVDHFYEKLLRVERVLATDPARRIGAGRTATMKQWLSRLDLEEEGLD